MDGDLVCRTILFFATHYETVCSSLLSVAVISVVADVYNIKSSTYIDTLALLKASGRSSVKILKSKGA
jgi:hypothetical protein